MEHGTHTLIVFTDLDATLLDEDTFAFDAARPALDLLRVLGHPIVFCTSKTFAECRSLQRRMGVEGPLIVENGGCIHLPKDHGTWDRIALGVPYAELRKHLVEVRLELGLPLKGLGDQGPGFLRVHGGLGVEEAREGAQREFDEPFLLEGASPPSLDLMRRAFESRGLRVSRGGRFFHLSGGSDKGRAVRILAGLYGDLPGACLTVGLGDSPNDISMLASVDLPFLVPRPDGRHDLQVLDAVPHVRLVRKAGPAGWNEAVRRLLSAYGAARVSA